MNHGDAVSQATPTLVTALAHAGPLVQIVAAGHDAGALGSGVAGVAGQGAALRCAGGRRRWCGCGGHVHPARAAQVDPEALAGRRAASASTSRFKQVMCCDETKQ